MEDFFNTIRLAWDKLIKNREEDIRKHTPAFSNPGEIYMKRVEDTEDHLVIQFLGFGNAVDDTTAIQQAKRFIYEWIRKFAMSVQIQRGSPDSLILRISKDLKMSEAAISIVRRDPKSNKIKQAYKCVGGKKDGRRVADPSDCMGVPDWNKKVKFAQTKRAKAGQTAKSKAQTRRTNIVSRRSRKANQRLKKARGF